MKNKRSNARASGQARSAKAKARRSKSVGAASAPEEQPPYYAYFAPSEASAPSAPSLVTRYYYERGRLARCEQNPPYNVRKPGTRRRTGAKGPS